MSQSAMAKKRGASPLRSTPEPKQRKLELPADAFDCPICQLPMLKMILHCPQGHSLCEDCFGKLRERRCPSCQQRYPAEVGRNRALEALAEYCNFHCVWGCGYEDRPQGLRAHGDLCPKAPVPCFLGCGYEGSRVDLPEHVASAHSQDMHKVRLIPEEEHRLVFSHRGIPSASSNKPCPAALFTTPRMSILMRARIEDGILKIKVQHFKEPVSFKLEMFNQGADSVTVTGRTRPYSTTDETHQVWLCPEQGQNLWTVEPDCALLKTRLSLKPIGEGAR